MFNNKTPKQAEKDLNTLFKKYGIENKITVEGIKKWIWNAKGRSMEAVNKYNKKCLQLFPEFKSTDELNDILQVFVAAWNAFPHKELGGKSPNEIMQQEMKNMPGKEINDKSMPKIIVGNVEMEFDEFERMLKEMERVQKPFKKWIEEALLPEYKKYLELKEKSGKAQESHYEVADVFFQRVLHVGFVDLGHIRPEFINEEFPHWWPTHVMSSNLKPSQIKKSLEKLFNFIEFDPNL